MFPHHPSSCIAFMARSLSHPLSQTSSFLCRNMSTTCSSISPASRKDRCYLRIGVIILLAALCYCEAGKSLPKAKPKAIIKAHDTKKGAAVCKGKRCTTQAQSGHQGYCKSCFRVHFPNCTLRSRLPVGRHVYVVAYRRSYMAMASASPATVPGRVSHAQR